MKECQIDVHTRHVNGILIRNAHIDTIITTVQRFMCGKYCKTAVTTTSVPPNYEFHEEKKHVQNIPFSLYGFVYL